MKIVINNRSFLINDSIRDLLDQILQPLDIQMLYVAEDGQEFTDLGDYRQYNVTLAQDRLPAITSIRPDELPGWLFCHREVVEKFLAAKREASE